jgi:uncharacterized protein YlxP (DUF503 family)
MKIFTPPAGIFKTDALIPFKTNKTILLIIVLLSYTFSFAQTDPDSTKTSSGIGIKGILLDSKQKTALPYANILFLHKNAGIVTNEKGHFLINSTKLNENDTISFQYIGYETKKLTLKQLDSSAIVYLNEKINNLNEIFVFSKDIDARSVVKKVLENKDENYKSLYVKNQTFVRNRSVSDINRINFQFKKSSLAELDEEKIKMLERKIPRHSVSFTDFLGNLYLSKNKVDSLRLKIDPVKQVSLKDKNLADMEQMESFFEKLLTDVEKNEYWKIKSGILGAKIETGSDIDKSERDSLKLRNEVKYKTKYYRNTLQYMFDYSSFKNKEDWDFLYHTNRYEYTLVGGTEVNGEDVYIIDFVPKSSGKFKGRVFITLKSFALIRADYEYAEGKAGKNISMFGVGFKMNEFQGSISFEKRFDSYQLKYCSKKEGTQVTIDRNLSLIKKRKRFLIDKKLHEVKVKFNISVSGEDSFEMLVLDQKIISEKQFNDFRQKEYMKTVYVDQFDDALWKGYSIIEPTKQMREYKKE